MTLTPILPVAPAPAGATDPEPATGDGARFARTLDEVTGRFRDAGAGRSGRSRPTDTREPDALQRPAAAGNRAHRRTAAADHADPADRGVASGPGADPTLLAQSGVAAPNAVAEGAPQTVAGASPGAATPSSPPGLGGAIGTAVAGGVGVGTGAGVAGVVTGEGAVSGPVGAATTEVAVGASPSSVVPSAVVPSVAASVAASTAASTMSSTRSSAESSAEPATVPTAVPTSVAGPSAPDGGATGTRPVAAVAQGDLTTSLGTVATPSAGGDPVTVHPAPASSGRTASRAVPTAGGAASPPAPAGSATFGASAPASPQAAGADARDQGPTDVPSPAAAAAVATAPAAPVTAGSAAAAPAAAATPGPPVTVPDQVMRHLESVRALREGGHRTVLRLEPEQLGAVTVTVDVRAGAVRMAVAGGPEALAAVREGIAHLRSALADAGLDLGDVALRADAVQPAASASSSGTATSPDGQGPQNGARPGPGGEGTGDRRPARQQETAAPTAPDRTDSVRPRPAPPTGLPEEPAPRRRLDVRV